MIIENAFFANKLVVGRAIMSHEWVRVFLAID